MELEVIHLPGLSFLFNRSQYVSVRYNNGNINNCKSQSTTVSKGVPQGSILGPMLFILYVNDIDTVLHNGNYTSYADDFSLVLSSPDEFSLSQKCVTTLESIKDYFCDNDLFLNLNKTEVMRFHCSQNHDNNFNIQLQNDILESTNEVKFLGLTFDDTLNWKFHCVNLIKKINSLTYLFRNLRQILEDYQLIAFYHAQIDSRLRYGICLWGNSPMFKDVFIGQKRIVRIIARVNQMTSCRELFSKFRILTATCIYIHEVCLYVFKNKNKFKKNHQIHSINTREKDNFYINHARLKITYLSPSYNGLRIFNHLPKYIKEITSINHFKKQIKCFLIEKAFYSLNEYFNNTY